MCKQETKVCKDCGARRAIHLFLSKDGKEEVKRCEKCRAKRLGKQRQKLKAKRDVAFGDGWEEAVKGGMFQCCKKCRSIKPILDFKIKTLSGVGTCAKCAPPRKSVPAEVQVKKRYRSARDKAIKSGKTSTLISYIDCQYCGAKDVTRPNRTYFKEDTCYTCCVNRKSSKRSREESNAIRYPNIDTANKQKKCSRCETWRPFNRYHSNGKNGGLSSRCSPCRGIVNKERREATPAWQEKQVSRQAAQSEKEKQEAIDREIACRPTPIEYIFCKSCGKTEVKRRSAGYRIKDCCLKCCYKIRKKLKHWEGKAAIFNGVSKCGGCNKDYSVSFSDRSLICPLCAEKGREKEAKAKRISSSFRRNAKRAARRDGVRYDPYDIFKRDKWKCKLCGIKVQKRNYLLDDAAEVDHIVPLSMGGRDIPSNVQCTCRKCNNDKGATIAGQVSLFAMTSRAG